jgi:c-di-GMP-binding flagellar brake protein YcgR
VEEDRREYERLPTTLPLSYSAEAFDGRGMACDISMSGCTFQAETNKPKEGSVLRLALQISNELQPVHVEAVVRNVRQDHVGVEFLRLQPADKDRLQNYVRDLLARRGAEARGSEHHGAGAGVDFQGDHWEENADAHNPVPIKS